MGRTGLQMNSVSAVSLSEKFSLAADPATWGSALSLDQVEADDELHNPDPARDRASDKAGPILTLRGLSNLGCVALIVGILLTLFAGYPLISYVKKQSLSNNGGFNVGGTNASGQVPSMAGNFGLIDLDTPQDAYTKASYADGTEWDLVFSDEFNTEGRTFYPGDDPYWEAVDLHYWSTNNLEWYDPAAITTKNGSLEITLSEKKTHGLNYQGGMMSTWNKFCFTGGLVETSVMLPGAPNIMGLWPAVWAMGNLGRAGYGATLDGMWPYSYDACDVGTTPNQTLNNLPQAALDTGGPHFNETLSFLPGQRLSRCTCDGEEHPGPKHSDGTYVGRSAPEIDMFEAEISGTPLTGGVSQSGQWAPFNSGYVWFNTTENMIIPDLDISTFNSYTGGQYQQATSVITTTNQDCYESTGQCFGNYGFEYKPGFDGAYISWIANGVLAWTINSAGMAADPAVNISARPVPQEPMYLLTNLGQSSNFGFVDVKHIPYPVTMKVDYIRVYQPKNAKNIGCDPPDFPTASYINKYIDAYSNWNYTTWVDGFNGTIPKSSFLGQC
ncbi:glycoside hydrolase family 16 protein [Athelia psychrophila]|uniref:Glycoside hydrolase family 16 protein n=2 Tax=Athelia psychrophila TaxID=1759441 RepID=A0A166E8X2_9AGAM|nr:glycoside hydrolase family 16 protein [Fibularhizoctonia sp. CBS 109695]